MSPAIGLIAVGASRGSVGGAVGKWKCEAANKRWRGAQRFLFGGNTHLGASGQGPGGCEERNTRVVASGPVLSEMASSDEGGAG